ncbi:rhamnan synthesis F family protein [Mesorhizobium sp. 43Arga]
MTKRIAVAFFYDEAGILDEYMLHLIRSLQPFVERTIFVSNGPLNRDAELAVRPLVEQMIIRENEGFDVGAYKAAIEAVGYEALAGYDELLLYNHTFYGPIYPFAEMFGEMEARDCDFWGITMHQEMIPNPFTKTGRLPRHINSHFIAIRQPMLSSSAFRAYWETMPTIKSYSDSVLMHESRFTEHFSDLGYSASSYHDPDEFGSPYSCFIDIEASMAKRLPILKRRLFFHDPAFHDGNAINLAEALRIVGRTSDYDMGMIWKNIARTTQPRILATNASLISVLSDTAGPAASSGPMRLAVCAHIDHIEALPELLSSAETITQAYDFIATTDTAENKAVIEAALKQHPSIKAAAVRVAENSPSMRALFVTCRDLFVDDRYDLVCRLRTIAKPDVPVTHALLLEHHLTDNLVKSPSYTANVIDLFQRNPSIGMAIPPAAHYSNTTLGHGWYGYRGMTAELLAALDVNVPLDDDTPVIAYEAMFWFRPKALRKAFMHKWNWRTRDVEIEAQPAMERLLAYLVQDAGYHTQQIMCPDHAALSYSMLEFKFQKIVAAIPRNPFYLYIEDLKRAAAAQKAADQKQEIGPLLIGQAAHELLRASKRSMLARSPILFRSLRPFYRASRKVLTLGRR